MHLADGWRPQAVLFVIVIGLAMAVGGFKHRSGIHQSRSANHRQEQLEAVVGMELDFGQQVGQGNTEESAGAESHDTASEG